MMMRLVARERIAEAILKTVLFFASVHLLVLGIGAAKTGDLSLLNVFRILELDILIPAPQNGFLSAGMVVLVFAAAYALSKKR